MLRPARLQNRLLYPLHVHVQASLLERTRECVRRQRLEPREQREVAVVELTLAQNVCELDRVGILTRGGFLLAIVDAAFVENPFDDQLQQAVVGGNEPRSRSGRATFSGKKLSDEREYLLEAIAPGVCVCICNCIGSKPTWPSPGSSSCTLGARTTC